MQQATAGVQQSMFPDEAGHTSVVMVSYHTGPILWLALESVLVQPGLKELILVNNGNPPDI
ncbi:MAG: hypothetical protein IT567_05990, partial [Alphaproteobacteria bacterium]|nr:hypothetical protein [Alphaproteobacteria bacterium]